MGSKIEARRLAQASGVPIIPGFDASQDLADLTAAAGDIGYPVLVKAAAGGGGKGIRIARSPSEFAAALNEAANEAERSFGDRAMIVERYIQRPRHVEVQIVGDHHGHTIHLGTRECSVQRRYQKLLEEAPAPNLPHGTRDRLHTAAVLLARAIPYDSVGTVEFVVDDESGEPYFLEMNTRLQVEHPVTEAVTGVDLVELQIAVATGAPLQLTQDAVTFTGHSFEARINAEDPAAGFAPQIGTIAHLHVPADVRWDSGVVAGSAVLPYYDPMIAKLIVHGADREAARRSLASALDGLVIGGVTTNTGFQRWLVEQDPVVAGRVTTRFLDETEIPGATEPAAAEAAAAWTAARAAARGGAAWSALGARRTTPHRPGASVVLRAHDGALHEVPAPAPARWSGSSVEISDGISLRRVPACVDLVARSVAVNVGGHTQTFAVPSRSERWAAASAAAHSSARAVVAPFPATVAEVHVERGDTVRGGQPVVVVEAMKMLHTLAAAGDGVVAEVRVAAGEQVASAQVLVTFEDEDEQIGERPARSDSGDR
jgi:acetyl/propionyl-CoA carboxylase alpha subunit